MKAAGAQEREAKQRLNRSDVASPGTRRAAIKHRALDVQAQHGTSTPLATGRGPTEQARADQRR